MCCDGKKIGKQCPVAVFATVSSVDILCLDAPGGDKIPRDGC